MTQIRTTHGGIAEMVESPGWDESRTDYALRLLRGLRESTTSMEMELRDHVNGKLH